MTSGQPETLEVRAPADGSTVGSVPVLDAAGVREAVSRARSAQAEWAALGTDGRGRLLQGFREGLAARAAEAARLSSRESGKVRFEGLLGDVLPTLDLARFYARRAPHVLGTRKVRTWMLHKKAEVEREPFGVVGIISPWNFPILNPMRAVLAALATGNTVVLKPSEMSPLSALLMREIATEAGFPEDVFVVITGDGRTGAALVEAGVDKVSFTGSVAVGRKVAEAAAARLIPVTLELGGKNPMVVLADADVERAANLAVQGAFWNAGQICISIDRAYVEAPVYDRFLERVVEETDRLVVGSGDDPDADIGAITTEVQVDRLERQVADAVRRGGRVVAGGSRLDRPGRFFAPTVVADADHSMEIMREESFGPVLSVMKVDSADEAVRMANDSPYGLAASLWTRRERGRALVRRLRAGMVSVNDVLYHGAIAGLPFGGSGHSGYGRVHGEEGLEEMTRARAVVVDRLGLQREPVGGFPFRRFGEERAEALIHLLHGGGGRVRALIDLLRRS